MNRYTTSHLESISMKFLSGDQWLGGRSLHTTRSVAFILVGVVNRCKEIAEQIN